MANDTEGMDRGLAEFLYKYGTVGGWQGNHLPVKSGFDPHKYTTPVQMYPRPEFQAQQSPIGGVLNPAPSATINVGDVLSQAQQQPGVSQTEAPGFLNNIFNQKRADNGINEIFDQKKAEGASANGLKDFWNTEVKDFAHGPASEFYDKVQGKHGEVVPPSRDGLKALGDKFMSTPFGQDVGQGLGIVLDAADQAGYKLEDLTNYFTGQRPLTDPPGLGPHPPESPMNQLFGADITSMLSGGTYPLQNTPFLDEAPQANPAQAPNGMAPEGSAGGNYPQAPQAPQSLSALAAQSMGQGQQQTMMSSPIMDYSKYLMAPAEVATPDHTESLAALEAARPAPVDQDLSTLAMLSGALGGFASGGPMNMGQGLLSGAAGAGQGLIAGRQAEREQGNETRAYELARSQALQGIEVANTNAKNLQANMNREIDQHNQSLLMQGERDLMPTMSVEGDFIVSSRYDPETGQKVHSIQRLGGGVKDMVDLARIQLMEAQTAAAQGGNMDQQLVTTYQMINDYGMQAGLSPADMAKLQERAAELSMMGINPIMQGTDLGAQLFSMNFVQTFSTLLASHLSGAEE